MQEQKSSKTTLITALIVGILLIPVIIVNMVLIVKSYQNPDELPGIFGITPVVVLSGSMEPTIPTGALIFIKDVEDPAAMAEDDIITYQTGDTIVTHRIYQVSELDGEVRYITMGDANNVVDRTAVSPEEIIGEYSFHIAGLGNFVLFVQTTTGMIVCVAVPVLLYLGVELLKRGKKSKAEEQTRADLEAQLAQLLAEKENSEKTE